MLEAIFLVTAIQIAGVLGWWALAQYYTRRYKLGSRGGKSSLRVEDTGTFTEN